MPNTRSQYLTYGLTPVPADLDLFSPPAQPRLSAEVIEQLREDFGDRFVRALLANQAQ